MDNIKILSDWPQPAVVADAEVYADEYKLNLRYNTPDNSVAVVTFPLANIFQFGSPNDEAMGGHPLAAKGLKFYSVHSVEDSSWIMELEKRNSVHPQHNRDTFLKDKVHYIFTFQDSTFECVVTEGEYWKAQITICSSTDEADRIWKEKIGA